MPPFGDVKAIVRNWDALAGRAEARKMGHGGGGATFKDRRPSHAFPDQGGRETASGEYQPFPGGKAVPKER
jgi:hypothetical protein